MTYLLALSLIANLALAWLFLRDRAKDRETWIALISDEAKERVTLLNRIQAPQIAVAQSIDNPEPAVHVPLEDDEGFWEAMNGRT